MALHTDLPIVLGKHRQPPPQSYKEIFMKTVISSFFTDLQLVGFTGPGLFLFGLRLPIVQPPLCRPWLVQHIHSSGCESPLFQPVPCQLRFLSPHILGTGRDVIHPPLVSIARLCVLVLNLVVGWRILQFLFSRYGSQTMSFFTCRYIASLEKLHRASNQ